MSADQVEAIHRASLKVLAEVGIKMLCPEARSLMKAAGADVDEGEMTVRYDPALVEEQVAKAPAQFTIAARNAERTITVGGNNVNFDCVGGPSFANDLDRGRRPGNIADMRDFVRLIQALDVIHVAGSSPFEPLDLPVDTRHLDKYLAAITLTDKVWSCLAAWAPSGPRTRSR